MITKQTKTPFPILDKRGKPIVEFIIYLKVVELIINEANITVNGFYYYKDEQEEIIVLDKFSEFFTWDIISAIEMILQPLDTISLMEALLQRMNEFTDLQIQSESGQNYGTLYTDWE
jgi:hypothetical protein